MLAYTNDQLGRRTNEYLTSTSGTLLASWTYDTLAKGQVTSSSSYDGSDAYTTTVTCYDDAYRPLGPDLHANDLGAPVNRRPRRPSPRQRTRTA